MCRLLEEITPDNLTISPIGDENSRPFFHIGICLSVDRLTFAQSWDKATAGSWALLEGQRNRQLVLLTKTPTIVGECHHDISIEPAQDAPFVVRGNEGVTA
jgi:hypothetical protein